MRYRAPLRCAGLSIWTHSRNYLPLHFLKYRNYRKFEIPKNLNVITGMVPATLVDGVSMTMIDVYRGKIHGIGISLLNPEE